MTVSFELMMLATMEQEEVEEAEVVDGAVAEEVILMAVEEAILMVVAGVGTAGAEEAEATKVVADIVKVEVEVEAIPMGAEVGAMANRQAAAVMEVETSRDGKGC